MTTYYQPELPVLGEDGDHQACIYERNNLLAETQNVPPANLNRWFELDSDTSAPNSKGAVRVRRRPPAGSDHVKHRRTRSGCYTCRSRRVKGGGCKKGSRECVYPEPTSSTKSSSGPQAGHHRKPEQSSESSSGEYEDEEPDTPPLGQTPVTQIQKVPSSRTSSSNSRSASRKQSRQALRQARAAAVTTSQGKDKSVSPSTDESSSVSKSRSASCTFAQSEAPSFVSTTTSIDVTRWSHLPSDLQYYLDFHQNQLNYHHYLVKLDAAEFVHGILLDAALNYEPLLYAVVGFAAFHSTLQKYDGKIQDFLGYYNKSVSLLLKSLQSSQKYTDATLLTILQLAAFEEYLGDWVNLLGHQKAAFEMLVQLYSPQTVMHTEASRKILAWYSRFDVWAGYMAGSEVALSREWFCASVEYFKQMLILDPTSLGSKFELVLASHRLLAMDMAFLCAKLPRGIISVQDFIREDQVITEKVSTWRTSLEELVANQEHLTVSYEGAPEPDPEDIVDPYRPGGLYTGPLWTWNYLMLDWYAFKVMHAFQVALMLQQSPPADLGQYALELCRIFEAIEYWQGSPPAAILPAQVSLAVAGLFLQKDERHIMWIRRKLASIESMGYTFPLTHRKKMAEIWNIPELPHWWLPNDEGYPPIIRSIRTFVEERTLKPSNQANEDVRNMRGIFSKMSIFDESPKDSPSTSPEGSSGGGEPQTQHGRIGTDSGYMQLMEQHHGRGLDAMLEKSVPGSTTEWRLGNISIGQEVYPQTQL